MPRPLPARPLTTITGFNPAANDILDLNRTLAATNILPDLSNVGSLVTSAFSGGNTMLYAAPTSGGSPVAFAVLNGVNVTVAQLSGRARVLAQLGLPPSAIPYFGQSDRDRRDAGRPFRAAAGRQPHTAVGPFVGAPDRPMLAGT